jgi:chromodomain-helicase-DNA-binding protein 7
MKMDDEKLKKMINLTFICLDCQQNVAMCFKCKKKGTYYPELQNSKSKSKANKLEVEAEAEAFEEEFQTDPPTDKEIVAEDKMELESDSNVPDVANIKTPNGTEGKRVNELTKCSTANCNKFYHLPCIANNTLFKYFDANKHKKFRCSLHYCAKCRISGDTMAIAQCARCPKAYHLKCYPKEKILKLTKKVIICQDHKFDNKIADSDKGKQSVTNSNEGTTTATTAGDKKKGGGTTADQLKIQKNENESSTIIKIGRGDNPDSMLENGGIDDLDDVKIPKKKGRPGPKKVEEKKEEKSTRAMDRKNDKNIVSVDLKIGEDIIVSNLQVAIGKGKRKAENNNGDSASGGGGLGALSINKKKERKADKEKLTYSDLSIDPPEIFNYESYDYDWCRYCGARYSSNFTKGPWGSRTLCTIHYIDWNQKKVLNLTAYKDCPRRPIKVDANTELSYLQKMVVKNDKDKEALSQMLESLRPSKKIRRAENELCYATNMLDKDKDGAAGDIKEEDVKPKEEEDDEEEEEGEIPTHKKGNNHHHNNSHLHSTHHPHTQYHKDDVKEEQMEEESD